MCKKTLVAYKMICDTLVACKKIYETFYIALAFAKQLSRNHKHDTENYTQCYVQVLQYSVDHQAQFVAFY